MNCTTFTTVIAKYRMLRNMKEATQYFALFQIFQYYEQKKNDETNVKKKPKSESAII